MKYYFKIILLFIILTLSFNLLAISSNAKSDENSPYLILDFKNEDQLPENFRKTSDLSNLKGTDISKVGLDILNISGSSDFTDLTLNNLIKALDTTMPITIIDLRQESHGLINGNSVSWYIKGDYANAGLDLENVTKVENELLNSIPFGKPIKLNEGKYSLIPTSVLSEEQLVSSKGNLKYVRFPVTDNERPTDKIVDEFIKFAINNKNNSWLHFHCDAGDGRTTTFMVMYDMMINSNTTSLTNIINRQEAIGGINLLKDGPKDKREIFIKNFYTYCQEASPSFKISWSTWINNNNIKPFVREDEIKK